LVVNASTGAGRGGRSGRKGDACNQAKAGKGKEAGGKQTQPTPTPRGYKSLAEPKQVQRGGKKLRAGSNRKTANPKGLLKNKKKGSKKQTTTRSSNTLEANEKKPGGRRSLPTLGESGEDRGEGKARMRGKEGGK